MRTAPHERFVRASVSTHNPAEPGHGPAHLWQRRRLLWPSRGTRRARPPSTSARAPVPGDVGAVGSLVASAEGPPARGRCSLNEATGRGGRTRSGVAAHHRKRRQSDRSGSRRYATRPIGLPANTRPCHPRRGSLGGRRQRSDRLFAARSIPLVVRLVGSSRGELPTTNRLAVDQGGCSARHSVGLRPDLL